MKFKVNKKIIICTISITFILSAILYNFLYKNKEKNEIFNEFEEVENIVEENIDEIVENTIFIDVEGEVNKPGLYELKEKSRVNDAINIAGGVTENADLSEINLAYILSDAIKLTIPKKEDKKTVANSGNKKTNIISTTMTGNTDVSQVSSLVNINTATKNELKTLSGIGDSTAQKIIDYRSSNGGFKSIEDIKKVSGIGDSKYKSIKDKIEV